MAEIVNLRRARKAKARAADQDQAAQNRARFGTPKTARDLAKARTEKVTEALDAHRLDKPRPPSQ